MTDLVGERERVEMLDEIVHLQPLAQAAPRRVDGIGDHRELVGIGEGGDGLGDALDGVRRHRHLHLFEATHQLRAVGVGQGATEPCEQHRDSLVHRPRDVLVVPYMVEGRLHGVVSDAQRVRVEG